MNRLTLLPLAGLAACSSEPLEQLRVDLPVAPDHAAAIIAVHTPADPRPLAVTAAAIDGERRIEPVLRPYDRAATFDITALLYEQTLDALAIEPGPLEAAASDAPSRPLPDASAMAHIAVAAELTTEWEMLDAVPPELATFRIARPDPCVRFEPREISLGAAPEPSNVLALDDRWALVTTSARLLPGETPRVFFVDGETVVEQAVPISFFSGYRWDDGTIWLGGERGAIYRGTFTASPSPRLELVASSTVSSREDVIDLVGPPDGEPFEHFALTTNRESEQWGAFEWFDGTRWRTPGLRRNTPHDATWVGPGYGLFASFFRKGEVFGVRNGAEISIDVTSVVLGNVVVIESMPGYGLVAGTTGGDVHRDAGDGTWARLTGSTIERIGDVHRYDDGLVFLRGSALAQYHADPDAACDDAAPFLPDFEALQAMDVVGGDVVVPFRSRTRPEDELGDQLVVWFARAE